MSIDYHLYLGPYAECDVVMKDSVRKERGCPNGDCERRRPSFGRQIFCPECGSKMEDIELHCKVPAVETHELFDDEFLAMAYTYEMEKGGSCDVWIPNIGELAEDGIFDAEGTSVTDITPQAIDSDVSEFLREFPDQVKKLKEAYGEGHVRIKWGMVQWSS